MPEESEDSRVGRVGRTLPNVQPSDRNQTQTALTDFEGKILEQTNRLVDVRLEEERKKKGFKSGGLIGYLIGDREHAPTRIAFVILTFLTIPLAVDMIRAPDDKAETAAFALVGIGLGYLFGRAR